jgi:predicted CXXCH cytochrome family protein
MKVDILSVGKERKEFLIVNRQMSIVNQRPRILSATAMATRRILLSICLSLLIPFLFVNAACAYTAEDCINCHKQGSEGSSLQISMEEFSHSLHGSSLSCMDCHIDIKDAFHEKLKGSSSVSCGECHEQENRHGLGARSDLRPKCYSCHTKHRIMGKGDPASSVHPKGLKGTCATCHPAECGRLSYLSWFPSLQIVSHGKQDFSRPYDRGNCLGCHQGAGAHGEKKAINDQTCYKCHNALIGYMHPKAEFPKQPGVFASAWIYQLFLAGLLWGGFRFYTRNTRHKKRGRSPKTKISSPP